MPADFDKCIQDGGKVVTINPKKGRYLNICYDKNGKAHPGKVKKNKEESILEKAKAILRRLKDLI